MEEKGSNEKFNYQFIKDSQIIATLKELFDKHGVLFFTDKITILAKENYTTKAGNTQVMTTVQVGYKFIDEETGAHLEGTCQGVALDDGDKGRQKAITSAIKYLNLKTFCIPVKDVELDDESPEVTAPADPTYQPVNDPLIW